MKVYVPKNCEHCYGRGCVCEEDMNYLPPEFLLSEEEYQQLPLPGKREVGHCLHLRLSSGISGFSHELIS